MSIKLNIARIIYESDYLSPLQKLGLIREISLFEVETSKRKTAMSGAGIGYGAFSHGLDVGFIKAAERSAKKHPFGSNFALKGIYPQDYKGLSGAKRAAKTTVRGAAVWAAYRGIRAIFDECTRKCGALKINNAKRQECMMECKKEYLTKKLQLNKKK